MRLKALLESGMVFTVNAFQQVYGAIRPVHRLQGSCLHVIKSEALGVCQVEIRQRKSLVIHKKLRTVPDPKRTAHISRPAVRQSSSLEIHFAIEPTRLALSMVDGPSGHIEAAHPM